VTGIELIIIPPEKSVNLKNTKDEKWVPLDNNKTLWLRIIYGSSEDPITMFNLYRIYSVKKDRVRLP
jgi:hypothetical protein